MTQLGYQLLEKGLNHLSYWRMSNCMDKYDNKLVLQCDLVFKFKLSLSLPCFFFWRQRYDIPVFTSNIQYVK